MDTIHEQEDFIPYQEALELKKLGFDEPCRAKFMLDIVGDTIPHFRYNYQSEGMWYKHNSKDVSGLNGNGENDFLWSAPTYKQTFKWLRNNHNYIKFRVNQSGFRGEFSDLFDYEISFTHDNTRTHSISRGGYDTYEQAETECVERILILIQKMRNVGLDNLI